MKTAVKNKPLVSPMWAERNKLFTNLGGDVLPKFGDGYKVATFHGPISMGSLNAAENARRFNAHDELVKALHQLICSVQDNERREWSELTAARAALAKAMG